MNLDLTTKHAFVCGSTQGIGKSVALELAKMGASVTLVARNEKELQKTVTELAGEKGQSHDYIRADFDHPKELKEATEQYLSNNAGAHILINNSGGPPAGLAIDADPEEFRVAFNRHLICNQVLTQALVPTMKEANFGRIINIISTSVKAPIPGLGVSNTIRGGVANWAKTLANELGPFGITVNNVLPGATKTARLDSIINANAVKAGVPVAEIEAKMQEEIPARRFAEAVEVAAAVAFLASPAAGYINGINVPVDGGRLNNL
ncbi:MAG: SDR family oxidoreductase [Cytophagales bacterium]|nr:SDR family oxidoreductase [Cytophagales bacterium]